MQTVECRLGLKCRLRSKLSHRLIRDIFSLYDLYIGNKNMKLKLSNGESQKTGIQFSDVCVTSQHLANLMTSL